MKTLRNIVPLQEGFDHNGHVSELVLYGDNDAQLHRSSKEPIMKNLTKKKVKGTYEHEKAKKLWGYHADRAAQSYHKEFGDKSTSWHHMFPPHVRKDAAKHWADEFHKGNLDEKIGTSSGKGLRPRNFQAMVNVDVMRAAKDELKKKYKTREDAIAALHTLSIDRQNAIDKNNYRLWSEVKRIQGKLAIEEGHGMFRANFHGVNDESKNDGKKYKVVRMHKNGQSTKTIAKGLSLSAAQSHCHHPETSSSSCKGANGKRYTKHHGEWFDGYNEER